MAVTPGNLNVAEKTQNMSVNDCFQSHSTVLQGQPFGGVPTVLFLNIALWVVSPGHCGGQTVLSQLGQVVRLSQVMRQGPGCPNGYQPQGLPE